MIKKNALEPGMCRNCTKKNQDAKLSRAISFLFVFLDLKNCSALGFEMAVNYLTQFQAL